MFQIFALRSMVQKLNMEAFISTSTNLSLPASDLAQELTENNLSAKQVLHKVLEYHRTHRPKIPPKLLLSSRKIGSVCFFFFFFLFLRFLYFINHIHEYLGIVQAYEIYSG